MRRGAPDHWKMRALSMCLKVPVLYGLAWANGTMERLWHYTAKYHPQGDIGKAPDWAIAEACAWPADKAAELIEGMVESKFVVRSEQHRLLVHDWPQHADDSVKKTLKNNGLEFFFPESRELTGIFQPPFLSFPSLSSLKTSASEPDAGAFALSAPETAKPSKKAAPALPKEHECFAAFWELRWSSKDKEAARVAFNKAATSVAIVKQIMLAVANQRAEILSRPLDKRPYMSTWLNKCRFADEQELPVLAAPVETPSGNGNGSRHMTATEMVTEVKRRDREKAERAKA